jgi:hypothetical protein
MPKRPQQPFPFGAGIDRATGEGATSPGEFRDIRNLVLKEGKAQTRKGLSNKVGITMNGSTNAATDLMHIGPFRAAERGLIVATEAGASAAQAVEVWRTATTGLNPTFCYAWVPPIAPPSPVQVFGAESYSRYFLAHDEELITRRASTVSLNTSFAGSVLNADLDGAGANPVKFRGVSRYLNYLVGWGFGTNADQDRPEILRMSYPGDPTTFDKNHYFVCGARTEPILNALAMPGILLVCKESELYAVEGYDRTTFGLRLADSYYGLAGSHLAVVAANGECYFWSKSGPRVTNGGPSQDLGLPLDLDGPQPADLVASGDAAYGWAAYISEQRLVLFGFPDRGVGKTRVYCLSVREPQNPRWSYLEFEKAIMTVGLFYAATGGAPTGYPDIGTLTATADALTVPWTNIGALGDETVEVWLKVGAGSYLRVYQVTVSGASQSKILDATHGVTPGATHYVALRYRRGVAYTADYNDPVTGGWGATPITQSVDSIAVPADPAEPSGVSETDCFLYVYGGKTYSSKTFAWTNNITAGAGHVTDILEGSIDNPDLATVTRSVPVTAPTSHASGYGWLVSPGGNTTPRYVWLRNRLATGETSDFVVMPGSPFIPADGCAA